MTRAAGVDPGTKSMDICAIEDGRVYYENPFENLVIANAPEKIIAGIREALPLDLIAGPSGYGVEPTRLDEIPESIFEDWYYNYVLLTTKEEILKGIEDGIFGAILYKNMTDFSVWLRHEQLLAMFIPSVIELPTVPYYRKLNKLDMGTADKLAVAVLGVHDQSRRFGIPYSDVSFILVEVGFGYNAVIGVDGGRVVDGIGGTNFPGIGFLTASAVDGELVQIVHNWERKDTFEGGVVSVTGEMDPDAFVSRKGVKNEIAFDAMMEGIEKAVAEMTASVKKPREILISGRWTKQNEIKRELIRRLLPYADVRSVGFLEGAEKTKETAQGYAMVADGLAGGTFKELIEWMQINKAKGTALEYVHHPKLSGPPERFVGFK
ncbi:MAG: DUF1464 family protein [Methanomicrobia archaeon]|nr:DUF1464 family protein [Methanomicrobia archaeon]